MFKIKISTLIIVLIFGFSFTKSNAQQDPQYTHYMYNTMSVNPGYAGQRETFSAVSLYRTQWVGINGAPETQTFAIHGPLRNEKLGLGLSIVNDKLGPANEVYADANFSYTISLGDYDRKLSFGLKAGLHNLYVNWREGLVLDPTDPLFEQNLNKWSPTIGAGLYFHTRKWYLGLAVPNFLTTDHFKDDGIQQSIASERLHYFLIGGYVFDLSETTKLKPAFLVKAVSGAPLIADVSANLLFNEKFTLGLAWRWDDSISGLAGFQLSESLYLGYSYDRTTTRLNNFNSGTHEIMLRFEIANRRFLSPRFF